MKKYILVFVLFAFMANAQEAFRTAAYLKTNGLGGTSKTTAWHIKGTAVDTSEVFPLDAYMTFKFYFVDTTSTRNDSCRYKVELFTSSISSTYDSTFTFATSIFTSTSGYPAYTSGGNPGDYIGGWTRPINVACPADRWGVIKTTGLTGNTAKWGIAGRVVLNGWSNQTGALLNK